MSEPGNTEIIRIDSSMSDEVYRLSDYEESENNVAYVSQDKPKLFNLIVRSFIRSKEDGAETDR